MIAAAKRERFGRLGAAAALAIAGLFLGACANYGKSSSAREVYADIIFTAEGCPDEVIPAESARCKQPGDEKALCAGRNEMVIWRSVPAEAAQRRPAFEIYFSPFRSRPGLPAPNGEARAPIDGNAPIAEYKYTIVADGCEPLDPRIIVQY